MKKKRTLEALRKAKQAVDQANAALEFAIQELDEETLNQVAGGGAWDEVPTVVEHPYDSNNNSQY